MCNYLTDDEYIDKKVKDTNECVINQEFKLKGYKNYSKNDEINLILQLMYLIVETVKYTICSQNVTKITVSVNDYKRLQTPARITKYPFGYGWKNGMQKKIVRTHKLHSPQEHNPHWL